MVILALIGLYLLSGALPELRADGLSFFTSLRWTELGPFGIGAVLYWTVVIALISLFIALPVSLALALAITQYASARVAAVLTILIDLLAALPSLIFGIWGLIFLQPRLVPVSEWLSQHLSFIPIFNVHGTNFKSSAFIAGVVSSLMIMPIITSIAREVFSRSPQGEVEAAYALGATRWSVIKTVILPFGRGGIVGGAMLGLGRALGETIVVVLIVSPTFLISPRILESGANSVAALIALRIGEAHGIAVNALMAAGLTLFVVTLLVNMIASAIVSRSRSGAGVEL
jgi:phosphate transport system permease protein